MLALEGLFNSVIIQRTVLRECEFGLQNWVTTYVYMQTFYSKNMLMDSFVVWVKHGEDLDMCREGRLLLVMTVELWLPSSGEWEKPLLLSEQN